MTMVTAAFIPLRGGSKSIPGKNIKPIAGRPLAWWTINAAQRCQRIDVVYVATDSREIRKVVEGFGFSKVEVIGRSPETSTDTASTESAVLEFALAHPEVSRIVLIQATSPLLKEADLQSALGRMEEQRFDSLLSVVRQKRFVWSAPPDGSALPTNYDPRNRPRRQDFDGFLVENGAFYISNRDALISSQCRLNGRIGTYEMGEESYLEIDEPGDWEVIENILCRSTTTSAKETATKPIRMFVTDVDGVLTDAGMYYSESGDELKKFNTRDGLGMRVLQEAGIVVGIITSEKTQLVERRAAKLKVDFLIQGVTNKHEHLRNECLSRGLDFAEVAYIGDDINDLKCLQAVGWSACPMDAAVAVKKNVRTVLPIAGGQGAVRAFAEMILFEGGNVSFATVLE